MISSDELRKLADSVYSQVEPRIIESQLSLGEFCDDVPEIKIIYSQDWPKYDQACRKEKLMFLRIIKGAVEELNLKYRYTGNGRPPAFYGDIVKSLLIKSYHNYSSWRTESELKICKAMGILDNYPKRATINKYMKDSKVSAMLQDILKMIAEPLATIETDFAVDATGFSKSYGNSTWKRIRHTPAEEIQRKDYAKLHIVTGVKTNIICSALITKGTAHESPFFKTLLVDTAKTFKPQNVSADAGYLSRDNVKFVRNTLKAKPWIMPKKNTSAFTKGRMTPWNAMFYIFKQHQDVFAEFYHKRSNVESTFSSLKRKFGDFCRCKQENTQTNEILCKLVCYNACILAETLLLENIQVPFMEVN
jgi:transposase